MKATITLLPGDGIGPEVVAEGQKVLEVVADRFEHDLVQTRFHLGEEQIVLVPDQRRVAIAVTRGHRVVFQKLIAEKDAAHVHDILGVLRAGGHAHERLVRVLH